MAFRWWANVGSLSVVFGHLSLIIKKNVVGVDPLWQNFLDPRLSISKKKSQLLLNLCMPMEFSIKLNSQDGPLYVLRGDKLSFPQNIFLFSLKSDLSAVL